MSKYSEAKIFGGMGSLFALVGSFIPFAGPIVSIVGFIFLIHAIKIISEKTKNPLIFKYYIISFFCNLIAVITVFVILFVIRLRYS